MARFLIIGAGIAGQTAALHARRRLPACHEVVVISPNSRWNWIPSNIWVGVGFMKPEQVTFPLAPIYEKTGIVFKQARAVSIHPEGDLNCSLPFVTIEYTDEAMKGVIEQVGYDFLMNATGPKLNFGATKGLGPDLNSHSVCTFGHAASAARALDELIEQMKKGEHKTLLIGTGHGTCTCQGAAFEYAFNVDYKLRQMNVRDKADIIWISNEYELGDFGVGGLHLRRGGYLTHSKTFTESLYSERGIKWITRAHIKEVGRNEVSYETLDGEERSVTADFAMLLPPFSGVGLQAFDKLGADITSILFAASAFMIVDADYTKKSYDKWSPADWPKLYQNPAYHNIFAAGIAFAPPHPISKPMLSRKGTPIFPTPPRTGMPSGVMAREIAFNITDMMTGKSDRPIREASMANMGAACIASAGANFFNGTAASITMYPIVPDYKMYPETGRSKKYTTGEIGLAGHWIKHLLHYAFIYKAKAKPLWQIVPE